MTSETATLAGGCFWCMEAVFDELKGVESVESGYMGGHVPNPTYQRVCEGDTGHVEVVRIHYDSAVISYDDLLDVFFTMHDPTSLNRQGDDVGAQYRSAVFFHTPEQQRAAQTKIATLEAEGIWGKPIVTEVTQASDFYVAEDYHQEYFRRTGNANPYCAAVVAPKVAKFRQKFLARLKR